MVLIAILQKEDVLDVKYFVIVLLAIIQDVLLSRLAAVRPSFALNY